MHIRPDDIPYIPRQPCAWKEEPEAEEESAAYWRGRSIAAEIGAAEARKDAEYWKRWFLRELVTLTICAGLLFAALWWMR